MNFWVFMTCEPDVADLPGSARLEQRRVRSLGIEDAMGILEPKHLVVLHEVDAVRLEPAQRFVELALRLGSRTAVDLGHQEHSFAITIAKRLAHPHLARAV